MVSGRTSLDDIPCAHGTERGRRVVTDRTACARVVGSPPTPRGGKDDDGATSVFASSTDIETTHGDPAPLHQGAPVGAARRGGGDVTDHARLPS